MSAPEISVVLPVHRGVEPQHFRRTVDSLIDQTTPAGEVVLVEDGPLPLALADVVTYAKDLLPVTRVVLPHNQGAGVANQAGLEAATGVWIAKADADDINLSQRFERQLSVATENAIDVCGSAMLEFSGEEGHVAARRGAPLTHDAIARRMRTNNPINHPTAFYRRAAALSAGGYPDWRYMQDYGLFARMIANGCRAMNLAEALVLFRAGEQVSQRRGSPEIRRLEVTLQGELRRLELIGIPQMIFNIGWRSAYRLLPSPLIGSISSRLLARRTRD